jgi:hypothetical protein
MKVLKLQSDPADAALFAAANAIGFRFSAAKFGF